MSTRKRKIKKVEEEIEIVDESKLSPKELYDLNKEKKLNEKNKMKKKKEDNKKRKSSKSKKNGKSNLLTKIFAIVMIILMLASCLSSVLIYMNR